MQLWCGGLELNSKLQDSNWNIGLLVYYWCVENHANYGNRINNRFNPTAYLYYTRLWANAQRDGRPAEYRWHPVLNAANFGSRSLLECRAVTLHVGEHNTWRMHLAKFHYRAAAAENVI